MKFTLPATLKDHLPYIWLAGEMMVALGIFILSMFFGWGLIISGVLFVIAALLRANSNMRVRAIMFDGKVID